MGALEVMVPVSDVDVLHGLGAVSQPVASRSVLEFLPLELVACRTKRLAHPRTHLRAQANPAVEARGEHVAGSRSVREGRHRTEGHATRLGQQLGELDSGLAVFSQCASQVPTKAAPVSAHPCGGVARYEGGPLDLVRAGVGVGVGVELGVGVGGQGQ